MTLPELASRRAGSAAAEWIVDRRRWIWLAWSVAAIALLPLVPGAASRLIVGSGGAQGTDAEWVDQVLRTQFGSPFANPAVLVIDGLQVTDSSGTAALRAIAEGVANAPGVVRVRSYLNGANPEFVSSNGTFLVVGLEPDSLHQRDMIVGLRAVTATLQRGLSPQYPNATLDWTGSAAFDYDVQRLSSADASTAERRVLPVVLILLVLVFGSLTAALIPVAAGAIGIGMSLGAAGLIAQHWPLTVLLQNVVSMIGLGLGIDYALLTTSRFRESMARGLAPRAAAVESARYAGHMVLLSGSAVAIGFAALLFVPAVELRSIATGGILVVAVSTLLATTLLPGVLASLGARIEMGRLWQPAKTNATAPRWRRWGRWLIAHPFAVLLLAGAPLIALAWQARRLNAELPSGPWLPAQMESMRGATALQRMGRAGLVQAIRVVVELPATSVATSNNGWRGIYALSHALARDPRAARVRSLPLVFGVQHANAALLSMINSDTRTSFMSRDERLALIEVIPAERETPGELVRYVRELRRLDAAAVTGIVGARIRVGGLPAMNADYKDAIGGSAWRVITLVVCGTYLALLIGFRSVLVAAKAVALNLLVKILGFTLAVAVLIDATFVRMAVGPALLLLAGRWNWWPGIRVGRGRESGTHDVMR